MFVFDDLSKLSDKDIQTVLKNVETAQWAMALKGASDELKQKILGNLSQRAAAMLSEEMDTRPGQALRGRSRCSSRSSTSSAGWKTPARSPCTPATRASR